GGGAVPEGRGQTGTEDGEVEAGAWRAVICWQMASNCWARWVQVWRAAMAAAPCAPLCLRCSSWLRSCTSAAHIASPVGTVAKSLPGSNSDSESVQGAHTSAEPQASASKTRIVGMPGSSRAEGPRGMCSATLALAYASGAERLGR